MSKTAAPSTIGQGSSALSDGLIYTSSSHHLVMAIGKNQPKKSVAVQGWHTERPIPKGNQKKMSTKSITVPDAFIADFLDWKLVTGREDIIYKLNASVRKCQKELDSLKRKGASSLKISTAQAELDAATALRDQTHNGFAADFLSADKQKYLKQHPITGADLTNALDKKFRTDC